ncbi:MAG: sporulation protein YqfD [Eubacterium sp.]|jgi:similar to stage IV sporulation protein|nr:sporulation protein YqfD [Eubacterium sp.]NBI85706.1 sporulation protein YqfD [Lachnospiraceae bacterium]
MFLSMIKFFRGFLLVRLSGYSPERFLNLCSNHNILIWDLKNRDGCYEFHISIAGYRRLKPLLKKTKTRVTIKKRIGFPFFLYRYRKRKVFFAGIVLCIAFLLYLTTFIWLIDINGNSLITDDAILAFLEENSSSFGSKKSEIDCNALEEALRTKFEDIIWASVRLDGTKMTIDLQENLITKKETVDAGVRADGAYHIVADKEALVTSIITRKGTPLVKAGSKVKEGDVLVSSQLDIYNDSNEIVEHVFVASDADIYGQTAYTYEDSFPMQYNHKVRVGEGKSVYRLGLFSYQVKLPSTLKKGASYISYTESRQLAIAKDYYIPVTLEKTTYYACGYEKVTLTKDQAKARAEQNISQFLEKLKEKGIEITDKNVMIEFAGNQCQVHGVITAVEKIGKYEPAVQKEISTDERLTEDESD